MADLLRGIVAASARRRPRLPRLAVEPGRAIVGPSMVTLYEVGTVKEVDLGSGTRRYFSFYCFFFLSSFSLSSLLFHRLRVGTVKQVDLGPATSRHYVSVDGGMSDNIRTALYDAEYTVRLVSRVLRRRARPHPRRRQALRERRHRRARLLAARRPRPGRPARRGRRPAPTAARWPPTTTPCPRPAGRRRSATAARRVVLRRETPEDLLALDAGLTT